MFSLSLKIQHSAHLNLLAESNLLPSLWSVPVELMVQQLPAPASDPLPSSTSTMSTVS